MRLRDLQRNWDLMARGNAFAAILTGHGAWENNAFFQTGIEEVGELMRYASTLPVRFKPIQALDFGCGVGRLTQALSGHFRCVVGVDISPTMVDKARRYNVHMDKCEYVLNQTDDLFVFNNDRFDFIYTNITLQHIAPRYTRIYIREFIRVLKPGGLLVFQLPSELVGRRWVMKTAERILPPSFVNLCRRFTSAAARLTQRQPRMEMYGIPIREVLELIEANHGIPLEAKVDRRPTAEEHWTSYQYAVTK